MVRGIEHSPDKALNELESRIDDPPRLTGGSGA
jgi:hypothetical protein